MRCEEQNRLLNLYKAKVSAYSATVDDLTLTRGKISVEEYGRLLAAMERTRTVSKKARLALDQHR